MKWPAWIAAVSIAALSFRYTVMPPSCNDCCWRIRRDSVIPVAGQDSYLDLLRNDTVIFVSRDSIQIRGPNRGVRVIPATGLVLRPVKP